MKISHFKGGKTCSLDVITLHEGNRNRLCKSKKVKGWGIMEQTKRLQQALLLAHHGVKVIPLHHPVENGCSCEKNCGKSCGKHPIYQAWLDRSTSDPLMIQQLWQKRPQANIGVPMGTTNGLFALDIDGAEGKETVKEWITQYGSLPETWTVETGGGGLQLWYRIPQGITIPNSVKKIGINIDLRGEGGQSVAPGSLHASGNVYQWSLGNSPEDIPPNFPPNWLLEKIDQVAQSQKQVNAQATPLLDIDINGTELPQEKLIHLMDKSKTFQAITKGERAFESASERDLSLANVLAIHDFGPDEIISTLYHLRHRHGEDLKQPLYYQLTVGKAIEWAKEKKEENETMRMAELEQDAVELEELKQWMEETREQTEPGISTLPTPSKDPLFQPKYFINITDKPIHELATQAWQAILAKNHPPILFARNWEMVEVRTDEAGQAKFFAVNESRFRGLLDRVAQWVRLKKVGESFKEVPTQPPMYAVRDMLSDPVMPLPKVVGITHCPIFSAEGELETESGYLPKSNMYYACSKTSPIPEVPNKPSAPDIQKSLNVLFNELLIDFPFQNQASRAHALSMIMLPFVRQMIKGPTPLHLIDGSKRGVGKSFLARVAHYIATGADAAMMKLPKLEEETEKQIISLLMTGSPMMVWDNVTGNIDRDSLNSLLTSTRYSGRILGRSEMIELPNLITWIMTGNNVDMDGDIYRRIAWIRLQPQECTNRTFHHRDALEWIEEHRGLLIWAIVTLIQNWIAQGQPQGKNSLASFEGWSCVMGGILDAAGVLGFLDNFQALEEQADQEGLMWEQFCDAWWSQYERKEVLPKQLWCLAVKKDLLHEVLGDGNERSQKTRMGLALRKQKDRSFGVHTICSHKDPFRKTMVYELKR